MRIILYTHTKTMCIHAGYAHAVYSACKHQVSMYICEGDLEHEGIAKLDGQLQLLDEVGVVEGGDAKVVPLLLLPDPVEGLLLRVDAERVARRLQRRTE